MWPPEAITAAATLACRLEAGAAKPGNVTPGAAFEDMSYADFLASAEAVGPVMGDAGSRRVGETVLRAVRATRAVAGANTNLGTVLLLAPLARAAADARPAPAEKRPAPGETPPAAGESGLAPGVSGPTPAEAPLAGDSGPAQDERARLEALRESLRAVLAGLDVVDAELAYEAIRLARPGGMGRVPDQDVSGRPTATLLEAMRSAAERDAVAREYATGYALTFDAGLPLLGRALARGAGPAEATLELYLGLLSRVPDSLVSRKFGPDAAGRVSERAAAILNAGAPGSEERARAVGELDAWLRDPERGWNPGTTADLVAAALFVGLLVWPAAIPAPAG